MSSRIFSYWILGFKEYKESRMVNRSTLSL